VVGSCKHGNERLSSIKVGNFLTSWATINFFSWTLHHEVNQSLLRQKITWSFVLLRLCSLQYAREKLKRTLCFVMSFPVDHSYRYSKSPYNSYLQQLSLAFNHCRRIWTQVKRNEVPNTTELLSQIYNDVITTWQRKWRMRCGGHIVISRELCPHWWCFRLTDKPNSNACLSATSVSHNISDGVVR
jgi:hypothetical protein